MTDDLQRLRHEYADREQRLAGSDRYSLFNPAQLFTVQQRQRHEAVLLRRHGCYPLHDKNILEVGCGRGSILYHLMGFGAVPSRLYGIDLLEDRVHDAHDRLPHVALACADGQTLPYKSRSFDLVLQYTALSSVLDDTIKANIAQDMLRVLRPGGIVLWYDFWLNPSNDQTRGIRPPEIKRLFPGCRYDFHRITLAPPITRRLASKSWMICYLLEKIRLLNTHYLAVVCKPAE